MSAWRGRRLRAARLSAPITAWRSGFGELARPARRPPCAPPRARCRASSRESNRDSAIRVGHQVHVRLAATRASPAPCSRRFMSSRSMRIALHDLHHAGGKILADVAEPARHVRRRAAEPAAPIGVVERGAAPCRSAIPRRRANSRSRRRHRRRARGASGARFATRRSRACLPDSRCASEPAGPRAPPRHRNRRRRPHACGGRWPA